MSLSSKSLSHRYSKISIFLATAATVLSLLLLTGAASSSWLTELISIATDGNAGQGDAAYVGSEIQAGAVSGDGRYLVFSSLAENLTAAEVSGWHVYLRDRVNNTTTLIADGTNSGGSAVISADGRFIAFRSLNSQIVANDTNGSTDIFVYDRINQSVKRVSVASDGSEAIGCGCAWPDYCNGCEYDNVNSHPSISGDGRYITFNSFSSNFVDGDLDNTPDVFVHDQDTATTTIISRASDGNLGNASSSEPSISADGNFITFSSAASNLVAEDWNNQQDVFLWSRSTDSLTRISQASDGTGGNLTSTDPVISADGKLIAFTSGATNLASGDTNGTTYDVFLHNREFGTTNILSSGLASGGRRPAISGSGELVAFTSGTDDIYLFNVSNGQRQLIDDYMQFSALNFDGQAVAVSGYANMLPAIDSNNDKDVYLLSADGQEPPTDPEICTDGIDNDSDGLIDCLDSTDCYQEASCASEEPPPVDGVTSPGDTTDTASDDTIPAGSSSASCAYHPDGRFDPVLPGLILLGLVYFGWKLTRKNRK